MLKFIAIALLLGASAAAPSGIFVGRIGSLEAPASTLHATHIAPIAYARAPYTYAEQATLSKYDISSPLQYTATHEPALSLTDLAPVPLAYTGYPSYPLRYGAPFAPFGIAY